MYEWQQAIGQILHGERPDVFRIEPQRFGIDGVFFREIDYRVAAIDAREGKRVDQLLAVHPLAIVFRRPAQQAQEIHEGLRQEAVIASKISACLKVLVRWS